MQISVYSSSTFVVAYMYILIMDQSGWHYVHTRLTIKLRSLFRAMNTSFAFQMSCK